MSDVPNESVPAARDLPDLEAVQAKIDEAHEAEDHLEQVDPGAIDAGSIDPDDAPEGAVPPAAGYVEEPDPAAGAEEGTTRS